MPGRKRDGELVPVSEDEVGDRIFQAYCGGESKRAIAKRYNLPTRDVSRMLLEHVSQYRPEDRAVDAFCEVQNISDMQQRLRDWFGATDDPQVGVNVALAWAKLSTRKGEILGIDAPRRTEGQLNIIEQPRPNSTERIRAILDKFAPGRQVEAPVPTPQIEDGQPN